MSSQEKDLLEIQVSKHDERWWYTTSGSKMEKQKKAVVSVVLLAISYFLPVPTF